MTIRWTPALAFLLALLVAAVALVAVEVGKDAAGGGIDVADPCQPRAPFPGRGLDPTIQRIVLDGLDGAACRLHTTREELVLSLSSGSETRPVRWDAHTIEVAFVPGCCAPSTRRRDAVTSPASPLVSPAGSSRPRLSTCWSEAASASAI